jgi:hypothetical protein
MMDKDGQMYMVKGNRSKQVDDEEIVRDSK